MAMLEGSGLVAMVSEGASGLFLTWHLMHRVHTLQYREEIKKKKKKPATCCRRNNVTTDGDKVKLPPSCGSGFCGNQKQESVPSPPLSRARLERSTMKRGSCYHRGNVQDQQLSVIPRSASYHLASVSSEGFYSLWPSLMLLLICCCSVCSRKEQQPEVRILQTPAARQL